MSLIAIPNVFTVGAVIIASQHNANFSIIYSDYNGNITDANLSASAAISYSKLSLNSSIKNTDIASSFNTASGFGVVPSGGIIMWSGTIASIPSGWVLCNGSNSTPDLTNRFIVGADADVGGIAKSTVTGSAAQSGDGQIPAHTHTVAISGVTSSAASGSTMTAGSSINTGSFGTGTKNVAVFYALAYIMKI